MHAWGIPALNTFLLLSSGVTVTYAHWALKVNNRRGLILGLLATVVLGFTFLGFQVYEYVHAYADLNLKLTTGVFGSTFYMLTGFHGFHVTLGAVMLTVILLRAIEGPLHARPPLRLRGGGLVLALRGRGLAGALRVRLLGVGQREPFRAGTRAAAKRKSGSGYFAQFLCKVT